MHGRPDAQCILSTRFASLTPTPALTFADLRSVVLSALLIRAVTSWAAPAPVAFQPTWESLEANYQTPEWFRDAKFGIWAHWGPQAEPEQGDWYARRMYIEGEAQYKYHLAHYGPQSTFGFKDIIHLWKAENFDPQKLLAFYKKSGARYFMALANHHDNFDNFNSKYQPWNSVNLGPKKDLIGMWAAAAKKNGLRFGVSVHASRSWTWYEPSQGADKTGPYAGIPYDGHLTKADGKGLWWEGYDPQDLYAQNHPVGAPPTQVYLDKFFKRITQLIDDYHPDLVYFDDGVLPQRKNAEAQGLELVSHFYNANEQWHGTNEAVVNTKGLDENQRRALVYDIERGKAKSILPQPWQTDTCIGEWHYNRELFEKHGYKSAATVILMLADIVSRNGNLMLSVPVRADGTLDSDEVAIVQGIGDWLRVNGEAIYATRPWKVYGEGPSTTEVAKPNRFGGEADVRSTPYTAEDLRFTQSKDGHVLYVIDLSAPANHEIFVSSLSSASGNSDLVHRLNRVTLLGHRSALKYTVENGGVRVQLPDDVPAATVVSLRLAFR